MIRAVCFDLDGVFFTSESFTRFCITMGRKVGEEKAIQVLKKSEQMFQFKKGLLSENAYWDFVRSELKLGLTNKEIFEVLRDSYDINERVVTYVNEVRAAGFKTCICSNNFETRIRELNYKFNFLDLFDVVVLSFEVGIMKPDKGIYEVLVKKSGVLPQEIVYSDDAEEKLAGAKELGINTFVYTDFPSFVRDLRNLGVEV